MWISEARQAKKAAEPEADVGAVTMGGNPSGVLLGGERRWVQVYAPGGYQWRPAAEDQVLVIKAGGEQENPCLVGKRQEDGALEPGEVRIAGGSGEIRLTQAGVELKGMVYVNGMTLEQMIKAIAGK